MHVDPDTLERLLADRALGATHPDVDALLDAYLATDPQAAALNGSITRTVALADAALPDDEAPAPPRLDTQRIDTALHQRRARRYLTHAAALAAVLVLGLVIGSTRIETPPPRTDPPPVAAQPAPTDDPSHFWSAQRIAALVAVTEPRTDRPRRTPWTWTSLTHRPDDREVLQ